MDDGQSRRLNSSPLMWTDWVPKSGNTFLCFMYCPVGAVHFYWMEFYLLFKNILLIFVYFADSSLELLNIMVSSHRYWGGTGSQVVLSSLEIPAGGYRTPESLVENSWSKAAKQLNFYYNSDFVAGHKYLFIANGWVLCSGEPNWSGTSSCSSTCDYGNSCFMYKPSQLIFPIVTVSQIQQDKCRSMCEGIYFYQKWPLLLERTLSMPSFSSISLISVSVHKSVCHHFTS